MDSRQFQRYDRLLGYWAQYVREGCSFPGLIATSQWPEGKPTPCKAAPRARHAVKRLTPYPTPHSTRERPQSRPLCARIDPELAVIHGCIVKLPDDLKRFTVIAWLRGRVEHRDICTILALSSREVRKYKTKVFDTLPIVL